MVALRWFALVMIASGCADVERDCESCIPRPPSTLFVSDRGADAVFRYDGRTGAFRDVFASGDEQRIDRPASLQIGPSGHAYVAGYGRGDVVRYDVMSGAVEDVFFWDTRQLEEPVELAFRGDEVLVLGNDTGNVVVLDRAGLARRELGYPFMRGAHDMLLAPDEHTLYVAVDAGTDRSAIQVWNLEAGTLERELAPFDEIAGAAGVAMRDDGTLYVADWDRERIARFDPASGELLDVLVETGQLRVPVALDFGPDGALYVLDEDGIHRLDPDTGVELQLLVAARDGHNVRPRAFTFVTDHELAAAVARAR